ncbi:hypothetical protein CI238_04669, partial [Colletotrichum incanum]
LSVCSPERRIPEGIISRALQSIGGSCGNKSEVTRALRGFQKAVMVKRLGSCRVALGWVTDGAEISSPVLALHDNVV